MKRKFILLVIAIFIFNIPVYPTSLPTGTIRGVITDKNTHQPLQGATVIIIDSNPLIGTTTDENGKFKIENVSIGRVSLKFTYLGYKEVVVSNLILNTGKELVIDIEIEESVIYQKEIVITASQDKSNSLNKMTSVSARSFTVEETGRYAGSRNDVARMSQNYAGIMGTNDARNDIIIRGNTPTGLLWRVEGVDVPNPNHYGALSSTGGPVCILNNNVLSNSDFLTGAFPSEYGNAISGVFDLKLRNGNNEKHEFLGQIGFNGFEFGAEGPISKKNGSSYLINARYSTLEVMQALGMSFGTGAATPKYKDISMKLNFPNTKLGSFSVFAFGGISDIKMWDSEKDTTKEEIDYYGSEGWDLTNGSDMIVAGITHTLLLNKNTYTKFIISGAKHIFQTESDSLVPFYLTKIPYYRNDFAENYFTAELILNHKINVKNLLKGGIRFKGMNFSLIEKYYNQVDKALIDITNFEGTTWLMQPYIQYQYKFTDDLTLNTGINSMLFNFNNTYSVEPRVGLKWSFKNNQSLNFGYGAHSQINTISEYFRQTRMTDGSYKRLNEDLKLVKSQHIVFGYDRNISEFMRIKAEAYYQYLFNLGVDGGQKNSYSIINTGAGFGFMSPDNINSTGNGYNYGIEITFEHFLNKGFYCLLTASVFQSKYKGSDKIERNSAFNSNFVLNGLVGKEFSLDKKDKETKSKNTLSLDLKTTFSGGQRYTPSNIYLNISGYYTNELDDTKAFSKQYKPYNRTDFKISYRRNGRKITQEWGLDIQNVFNQKNIFSENFNKKTGEKYYIYQTGFMAIPQYRIIF